ncbi:MAG TPA: lactonase family protein [Bryobacteraceae bacterium]|nr:lactonase family protein [Bryobacteraceae bacterium]
MKTLRWITVTALAALSAVLACGADTLVYLGTYTDKGSQGIYSFRFDPATGQMTDPVLAAETPAPSFLAIDPTKKFLYAVNETGDGSVTSFAISPATGRLTQLNQVPSGGKDPCHLVVDPTGYTLIVANYTGGSVSSFPLKADGQLGQAVTFIQHHGSSVNKSRQEAAHAHEVVLSHDNRFAIVCDLGLDKLMVYRFDAKTGKLTANDPPSVSVKPGSGPRHFVFDSAGRHGYLINEMGGAVMVFDWDAANGTLRQTQTVSTLPRGFRGENTTAEIAIHPSGRFLYGSNRGDDSIVLFGIEPVAGKLRWIGRYSTGGKTPRNFAIDPAGKWLLAANQDTDGIVEFEIDQNTGALKPAKRRLHVSQPVCVLFTVR